MTGLAGRLSCLPGGLRISLETSATEAEKAKCKNREEISASQMAQLGKESACNTEDMGSILRSERSPGGGHGNPLQHSYIGNPIDRGAGRATVCALTKPSDVT